MSKPMPQLTEQDYWDEVHAGEQREFSSTVPLDQPSEFPLTQRLARAIKKCLGKTTLERMTAYDDYLLWNVILPNFLPPLKGANSVEIGSAPGEYSVEFARRFGCTPYGVEYSPVGVQLNREVFSQNGFNP